MGNNHANAAVMTMSSGGDSRHGSSRGRGGGQYHLSHPSTHHLVVHTNARLFSPHFALFDCLSQQPQLAK
ncbi:hypothetical protein niasHS_015088 [Heterodera schachtii]|uniref:Uncharacterized protein n=1 Tax=Heterodera schachtii TaxID=97005 RepID=A0ABD2IDM7_HETSC